MVTDTKIFNESFNVVSIVVLQISIMSIILLRHFFHMLKTITDRIAMMVLEHKVKSIVRSSFEITQIFPPPKGKLDPGVVKNMYSFSGSCGSVHNGETCRSVEIRLSKT